MGYETRCTDCWGKGRDWEGCTCRSCDGMGEVKPYRVIPNLSQAKALGFDPVLAWPKIGQKGRCSVCSAKLTGRQRSYCVEHGNRHLIFQRLYEGVHWTKRHVCVRDSSACRLCGEVFESPLVEGGPIYPDPRALELDHRVALHLGGTDHADNLQLLCPPCHTMKSVHERRRAVE